MSVHISVPDSQAPTAFLTGSLTAAPTEADIVAGGLIATVTLDDDTFAADTTPWRQAFIDSFVSQQAEANGWNASRGNIPTSAVARLSNRTARLTLPAIASYNIAASETIVLTLGASVLASGVPLVSSPSSFAVTPVSPYVLENTRDWSTVANIDRWIQSGNAANRVLTQDALAPVSPDDTVEMLFEPGDPVGSSAPYTYEYNPLVRRRQRAVEVAIKIGLGFEGGTNSTNKIIHEVCGDDFGGNGASRMFPQARGVGAADLGCFMGVQSFIAITGVTLSGGGANLPPNVVPGTNFIRGQWHLLRYEIAVNTADNLDGYIVWYLDGVKVGEYLACQWMTSANLNHTFSSHRWQPTWGSGTIVNPFSMSLDDTKIYHIP